MYAYTLVLPCSSLITSSIYSIFVEYCCTISDRPISTQSDLRPSAGIWDGVTLSTEDETRYDKLGIEFYLFVSHEGMKRQRVHV